MSKENKELCQYLKDGHFKRFMECWKSQFESYGHVGGTISVVLDDDNREDISGFIGKDYHRQKHAKISYNQVKKAILNSKYENADFNEVVLLYFDNSVISNKSAKIRKQEKCERTFNELLDEYHETKAGEWLKYCIHEQDSIYIRLKQEILAHPVKFNTMIHDVLNAINAFPSWSQSVSTFPIFAAKITQDPHAFDSKTFSQLLLFHAACYFSQIAYQNYSQLEKNLIFTQVGLVQEDVNNYCMIARINALNNQGIPHPGWFGFYNNFEMWNVNSHNLLHISKIDSLDLKHVFILENPSVFHELFEYAKKEKMNNFGFICTNGMLNMCAYQMLNFLEKEHIQMHYSGDFDPEGLLIADRLTQQFKNLDLWCYEGDVVFHSVHSKLIDQRRISMLKQLTHPLTKKLSGLIEEGFVGYQENMLAVYKKQLLEIYEKEKDIFAL